MEKSEVRLFITHLPCFLSTSVFRPTTLVQQLSPYSFWVLGNTFSLSHLKFMGSNSSSLLLTPDTALTPADFCKPCSALVSGALLTSLN